MWDGGGWREEEGGRMDELYQLDNESYFYNLWFVS